jgi:trk system potassium uptake protein TrkA
MKDIEVNKMARRKSFAVIGVNNIGIYTTKSLLEKNQSVTLYDNDSEKLNKIIDDELNGAEGVIIDSTNKQALENNGLTQFDGVIVCFENSLETSVVTTLNLIELEIENIIVIAKNERHKKILSAIGVAEQDIVVPGTLTGQVVATKSIFDIESEVQTSDGEFISTKITITEPSICDKTIEENNLNPSKDFNIVQIKRSGKTILPEPNVVLKEGDILMIYAKSNLINDLILKLSGDKEVT